MAACVCTGRDIPCPEQANGPDGLCQNCRDGRHMQPIPGELYRPIPGTPWFEYA